MKEAVEWLFESKEKLFRASAKELDGKFHIEISGTDFCSRKLSKKLIMELR